MACVAAPRLRWWAEAPAELRLVELSTLAEQIEDIDFDRPGTKTPRWRSHPST